jgi:hypothetical protein
VRQLAKTVLEPHPLSRTVQSYPSIAAILGAQAQFLDRLARGTTIVVHQIEGFGPLMIPTTLDSIADAFSCSKDIPLMENGMVVR